MAETPQGHAKLLRVAQRRGIDGRDAHSPLEPARPSSPSRLPSQDTDNDLIEKILAHDSARRLKVKGCFRWFGCCNKTADQSPPGRLVRGMTCLVNLVMCPFSGWFTLDVLSCFPLAYIQLAMEESGAEANPANPAAKNAKLFRIVRLVRDFE